MRDDSVSARTARVDLGSLYWQKNKGESIKEKKVNGNPLAKT